MDWMGHTIFQHTLTGNRLAVNIWAMCCPKDLGMARNYARKWEGCQTKEASTSLTIWCVQDIPILSAPAGVWIWTRCNSRLTNQQPSIFGGWFIQRLLAVKLLKNSQFWAGEHSRFLVVQPRDFWCKQRFGPRGRPEHAAGWCLVPEDGEWAECGWAGGWFHALKLVVNSTGLNHFGRTMGLNQKKGIFTEIYYQIWRFLRFRDGIYRQIYDRADVFHVTPQMKPCRGIEGMGCLAHLSGEAMILEPDGKAGAISDSCSQLSVF